MAIANTNTAPILVEGSNITLTQAGQTITIASTGGGGGTPGGSTTQVQFNDAGAFAGDAGFTYDKTNNIVGLEAIDWAQTPTAVDAVRRMLWDDGEGSLALTLKGGNVTVTLGTEVASLVYNAEATTLDKGTVVYAFGASGQKVSVKKAVNTGDSTSAQTFGVVAESIASGAEGWVIVQGMVRGIDTSAYTQGDAIYLSATAGQFTKTKPSAPNHLVYVGFVVKVNASSGEIFVKCQNGYELDEIHDVALSSEANNDLLVYESASTLWKNKSFATLSLPTGTGTAGYVTYWTGTNTQSGESNLFWDETNNRLGIGTTPSYALDVNGTAKVQDALSIGTTPITKTLLNTYNNAAVNDVIHGRFENTSASGRTQFIVTSETYPNNFFALMTHGSSYTAGNFYPTTRGATNDAGKGILLLQGANTNEFIIGTYNLKNLGLFTNNVMRMTVFSSGNVAIGTTTDAGFIFDVAGTGRFAKNTNGATKVQISNTTSDVSSYSFFDATSSSAAGSLYMGKYSAATTTVKVIKGSDGFIQNVTGGDLVIFNDVAAKSIILAAGSSSTAHLTIDSNGNTNIADAKNIILGTTTGTKIGTATSQKIGFYNATPVTQPSAVTTAQGIADALSSLGLMASSSITTIPDVGSKLYLFNSY